jgi:hypothetical protein
MEREEEEKHRKQKEAEDSPGKKKKRLKKPFKIIITTRAISASLLPLAIAGRGSRRAPGRDAFPQFARRCSCCKDRVTKTRVSRWAFPSPLFPLPHCPLLYPQLLQQCLRQERTYGPLQAVQLPPSTQSLGMLRLIQVDQIISRRQPLVALHRESVQLLRMYNCVAPVIMFSEETLKGHHCRGLGPVRPVGMIPHLKLLAHLTQIPIFHHDYHNSPSSPLPSVCA